MVDERTLALLVRHRHATSFGEHVAVEFTEPRETARFVLHVHPTDGIRRVEHGGALCRRRRIRRNRVHSAAVRREADAASYGHVGARQVIVHHRELTVGVTTVSYTHLRAHETPEHLVCRLLLEKKKKK